MAENDNVQVAVRVRPLNENESSKGSKICLDIYKNESQIAVRTTNHKFTYNYVFSDKDTQESVYDLAVKGLLKQLFKGYNVTILAYGQTGSGKTFTMGTNYQPGSTYPKGIIPLAVEDIFKQVQNDCDWEYTITASFIELYQEQLYDLLSDRNRENSIVDIREDTRGIYIPNLTEKPIRCTEETFEFLQKGSMCRATGATAMNAQSSRSHAIFTISLNFNKKDNVEEAMTAKFHLVDLAGSERSKKTQAVGERFKEGVNINKGLLALGNVVSALGEGHSFISYRDSKLTRLLQDSLGGNSQTLMIACVSPADYNQNETLSTLRYADRAKRIKNKPIINQDPKLAEIAKLRKEVERLNAELLSKRSAVGQGMPTTLTDLSNICPPEHQLLAEKNIELLQKLKKLMDALSDSVLQNSHLSEQALIAEKARDGFAQKLAELDVEYSHTLENLSVDNGIEPLLELQHKIKELQAEQKRNDEEMLTHAASSSIQGTPEIKINEDFKCPDTPKEEIEYRESLVFEQAKLNKELQVLTVNLALKEELVKKLAASSGYIDSETDSEDQIKEMQDQISSLQHEKDELLSQLRTMQQTNVGSKLAEQRRKRLQELEQKLTVLNKKVTEQARIIKMKEKSDEKIQNLNKEIMTMKQAKVRLIQQMKSESERFRGLKLSRERELCKLREQDRRRQNQMMRMEMLHSKQQNVLKRKFEEATAVNKRLKDALALKVAAQERVGTNRPERFLSWVDQELEVLVSTEEAEHTLEQLLKDRTSLNQELAKLKSVAAEKGISEENKKRIKCDIDLLSQDIELRNTQIADMQQKIMDSNQESKLSLHIDQLHNLIDAKNAIKHLFSLTTEARKDASHKERTLRELKDACSDLEEKLKEHEEKLSDMKKIHERDIMKLETDNEERVYLLLNRLHGKDKDIVSNDSNSYLLERIRVLNEELEKMDALRQENEILQEQIDAAKTKKKKSKANGKQFEVDYHQKKTSYVFDDDDDDVIANDNDENDPDWRNTPIMKRLQVLKGNACKNGVAVKRGSDGLPKCSCKSDCLKKQCSCRRAGSACSSKCKCNETCKNTSPTNNLSNDGSLEDGSDGSFKKPRALSPIIDFGNVTRTIKYDDED